MTRYVQSRAQCAELLRMALQRMSEHSAAFTPPAYALWFEHLAGINPRLSHALELRLQSGTPLDDDAVAALHAAHVTELDAATAERVSADMRRLMAELSRSAESAGGSAGAVGSQLQSLQQALHAGDPAALLPRIGEALDGTAQLQASVDALREQVQHSRREIEALRCELDRVLEATGVVLLRTVTDAGDGAVAARYGGEEFAVLLPGRTVAQARELAESVRAAVKMMRIRQRQTDRTVRTVTISVGVAELVPGEAAAAFVARADAALYASKRDGRDRVTASSPCEVESAEVVGE